MSNVVMYDPNGVVVNRVISYLQSVNTPDYENLPNVLINPDVSSLSSIPKNYWKVDSGNVVEMTTNEKTVLNDFLNAKTIREKKYKISTYDVLQRLTNIVFFDTDNGDGVYSGKAEQTTYTYFEDKVSLLHKKVETFYYDGTVSSTENYDYYKNDNNELIEKKV